MSETLAFRTPFLNTYMQMVEETESPRLFHTWTAIGAVAATLGRRCYLPAGTGDIYPNHFILLVGAPGTRKSTAVSIAKKQLTESTGVRIAPTDTGQARQGIIKALMSPDDKKEMIEGLKEAASDNSLMSIADIASLDNSEEAQTFQTASADKHHMLVCSTEFTNFIGHNQPLMLDFLGEMWDGSDVKYQLKNEMILLKKPLMNIIGATTPTHIACAMPAAAGGQGFLSRMILVYGENKYKLVPRPPAFRGPLVDQIRDRLMSIYNDMNGEFHETAEATAYVYRVYGQPLGISDPRFQYYIERRDVHLCKLAMVLAAMRLSHTITLGDYEEADAILKVTERGMPEALGQFGLSPIAVLKQSILDFLRNMAQPIETQTISATFSRDGRARDIAEALQDLVTAGLVKAIKLPNKDAMFAAVIRLSKDDSDLMGMLAER